MRRSKASKPQRDIFDDLADRLEITRASVIEEWEERAAVRQYLGEYSQPEAERLALADTERSLSRQRKLF